MAAEKYSYDFTIITGYKRLIILSVKIYNNHFNVTLTYMFFTGCCLPHELGRCNSNPLLFCKEGLIALFL